MKLKTIKDINEQLPRVSKSRDWIRKETIKAEAIKWVKKWMKDTNMFPGELALFIGFHNITEEDLK